MSVNGYALCTTGTPISWKASGGTYTLTLTSLTSPSARQGQKGDLGANWARRWTVLFATALSSAGTNGKTVDLYWARSLSGTAGTDNPGGTTGTDTGLAIPDEYKLQLDFIGKLQISNDVGTGVQIQYFDFYPPSRYGMPVVVNESTNTLSGTAGNHEVRFVPIVELSATGITG